MTTLRLRDAGDSSNRVGTNSAVFANGDFVSDTSGFLVKSIPAKRIIGIANGSKTFTSDNQTVAKATLSFTRIIPRVTRADLVTSADITQADVGKHYDIVVTTQLVDVSTALATSEAGMFVKTDDATAAVDPVLIRQVKLEKFYSARLGEFSFV